MGGIAELWTWLAAAAARLSNDHPLATGAFVGAAGSLTLAALHHRRLRDAKPTGGEADIQNLIARGEVERAADLLVERHQVARALPLYERAGAKAKLARALLQSRQPARAAKVYAEMGRHAEAAHHF
ncbi:MAG TPA: hypothetical protein VEN47_03045, partial [Myxococcota bacterium]|nr:hypothetical protein [Myxococcota bacterium]